MPSRREWIHGDCYSEGNGDEYYDDNCEHGGYHDDYDNDCGYEEDDDYDRRWDDDDDGYERRRSSPQLSSCGRDIRVPDVYMITIPLRGATTTDIDDADSPPPAPLPNARPTGPTTWKSVVKPLPRSLVEIQCEEKAREEAEARAKAEARTKAEARVRERRPQPPPRDGSARPRLLSSSSSSSAKTTTSSERKTELLCMYGKNHQRVGSRCVLAHTFHEWNPRVCRFAQCRNATTCIYWHSRQEDREAFFRRSLRNPNSFLFKNKHLYEKNYAR